MKNKKWHAREIKGPIDLPTSDRFWSSVDKSGDCWLWQKSLSEGGYGRFSLNRKSFPAHRVAYAIVNGSCPADILVCHECDNPRCVNTGHLFLGRHVDNVADMIQKGRRWTGIQSGVSCNSGEKNGRAKLTNGSVVEIMWLRSQGLTMPEIADRYEICAVAVSDILAGKRWRRITGMLIPNEW